EPPHTGAGVEGLRDRHERDVMRIEQLDHLREISERAGEPVDLVDQHDIDCPRPNIGQELLQSGAVERSAGECPIVVAAGDRPPAPRNRAPQLGNSRSDSTAQLRTLRAISAVTSHIEPSTGLKATTRGGGRYRPDSKSVTTICRSAAQSGTRCTVAVPAVGKR